MGGRLDATNVVNPLITVITNVSKDHQNFLGDSLKEIAYEKAGIIKHNTPVICGCKKDPAHQVIEKKAHEEKAPFHSVFSSLKNFRVKKKNLHYDVEIEINNYFYHFCPALLGYHQVENALIAVLTLEILNKLWKPLNRKRIVEAIENVKWPGRLEVIGRNPNIILDGAHNVEGIEAIKNFIQEYTLSPIHLVFAIMKDKEIEKITEIIFPLAKNIILTKFPYYRVAEPNEILKRASSFQKKIIIEINPSLAFQKVKEIAEPTDTILITGSLYLAGEIKKLFYSSLD